MPRWIIDSDHSVAEFSIRYLTIAHVRGIFGAVTGTIDLDPSDLTMLSVEARIDVTSVRTGNSKRDAHLATADFFDAARYPDILFRSTGVELVGGSRFRLSGELAMHGITRPVKLHCEFAGPVKIPEAIGGETSIGFMCATRLNREEFGITWGITPMQGGIMAAGEVQIMLDVEADLQG
ncbi:MAG: YceI family protein [Actinomycetota bacterium]|nr:YceI family protein [Actinomycetota bacterium]